MSDNNKPDRKDLESYGNEIFKQLQFANAVTTMKENLSSYYEYINMYAVL
jgi:hypothetical protein